MHIGRGPLDGNHLTCGWLVGPLPLLFGFLHSHSRSGYICLTVLRLILRVLFLFSCYSRLRSLFGSIVCCSIVIFGLPFSPPLPLLPLSSPLAGREFPVSRSGHPVHPLLSSLLSSRFVPSLVLLIHLMARGGPTFYRPHS